MPNPQDDPVEIEEMFPTAEEGRRLVRGIADTDSFRDLMEKLTQALNGHQIHEMCLAFSEAILVVLRITGNQLQSSPTPGVSENAAGLLRHLILAQDYSPVEVLELIACLLTHHVCVAEHNFEKFEEDGGTIPPGVTIN